MGLFSATVVLTLIHVACGAPSQRLRPVALGSRTVPVVQPGCQVMYQPGAWCSPRPSQYVRGCCTPGHDCVRDSRSMTGFACRPVARGAVTYAFSALQQGCSRAGPGEQCQPEPGATCCPDGYSCQTTPGSSAFSCRVDVQDQAPVPASVELLQYPPRPMPPGACACRHDWDRRRVPMDCPSPWASPAGTSLVPPALKLAPGTLVREADGEPAVLRGVNWFGWSVGTFNFDGLYAFCDDNRTDSTPPCAQDGDIPPDVFPSAAIGGEAQKALNISYWGKRRLTHDFAAVVWRIRLLGFNAVRVQFRFSDLNLDLPESANQLFPCLHDSDEYIALDKTLDPRLAGTLDAATLRGFTPRYRGMQHPPPQTGAPSCDGLPWSAPFLPNYLGGRGPELKLTQCNWYLPQGPGVPALHRFLWQLQYMVSQGLYILLDFSSTRELEPNMQRADLFADNWGRFWRILAELPAYRDHMRGRIFPDLVNEPSRWGCQWNNPCKSSNGSQACAPMLQLYGLAAAAIWEVDASVPIFLNGLGQDELPKFDACTSGFPGMHWGDGFITRARPLQAHGISDPSDMFTPALSNWVGPFVRVEMTDGQSTPRVALAPHTYPSSVTGSEVDLAADLRRITNRWDLSWGLKMQGKDITSSGARIPPIAVVVGESGSKDSGDNSVDNRDTTSYAPADRKWLEVVATYLRTVSERMGHQPSWFWWAWNANSGDTKGIVGPVTTWREVQWQKVRLLIRAYGLKPWYCAVPPMDFCDTVEW